MKRLAISLTILLVTVIAGDWAVGHWLRHNYEHTHYGEIGRLNYINDSVRADVVILGSSRALHHYVPSIITDSTGLTCYNCGFEGEGIVFHYALLRSIQQRYRPRLVIYELTYDYDVQRLNWRPAKLSHIRTMSHLACRDSILHSIDPWERVSMMSNIYPYNSTLFSTLLSQRPTIYDSDDVDNGYIPQYKQLTPERFQGVYYLKQNDQTDPLKVGYLKKLIDENATQLMVIVSPRYRSDEDNIYGLVSELCDAANVPFYCMVSDTALSQDITLWEDDGHFNDKGARVFTQTIIPIIRQRLKTQTTKYQ